MSKTKVIEVGDQAYFESFPLLVLFDDSAPQGLREVCIIHQPCQELKENTLVKGGSVVFDGNEYRIEEVGPLANKNLSELGHVSMYFKIESELLPGAILLSPNEVPILSKDSVIEFRP